jgi:hypothetical protein
MLDLLPLLEVVVTVTEFGFPFVSKVNLKLAVVVDVTPQPLTTEEVVVLEVVSAGALEIVLGVAL